MRSIRCLTTGLALLAMLPALAQGQEGRRFQDSWFWGLKAGNTTYWTTSVRHGQAQSIGAEWLLTRKKGGLLLGFDQTYFGSFLDMSGSERSTVNGNAVDMNYMRRVSAVALAFPREMGAVRPYLGVGAAVNFIHAEVPVGSAARPDSVREQSSGAALLAMVGAQYQLQRLSVFGQGSVMPTREGFLLNRSASYIVEFGVRYNFGTSIDR